VKDKTHHRERLKIAKGKGKGKGKEFTAEHTETAEERPFR